MSYLAFCVEELIKQMDLLREENRKLRRQHELALTYNHNRHGSHTCCPCVVGLQAYPQRALEEK